MFVLRQLVEKKLDMLREMALGFEDFQKAYDSFKMDVNSKTELDGSARSKS